MLVVDVGALQQLSSTALKQVAKYHDKLAAAGSGLVLAGIGDRARDVLAQTGLLGKLGEQNVLPPDPHLGASLDARAAARSRAARGAPGDPTCGKPGDGHGS